MRKYEDLKIAIAGTGYVGLSMAVLLSQNHDVLAVDVVEDSYFNELDTYAEMKG